MTKRILTQQELKEQLHYDPDTGIFTWKVSPNRSVKIGYIASNVNNVSGYIRINIFNVRYYAHRLAWLYITGEMPKNQIDHINHNRSDNRFENLRDVTAQENLWNVGLRKSNKSGFKGVYWCNTKKKWLSKCWDNGKRVLIGSFDDKILASLAYINYTKNLHKSFYYDGTVI